MKYMMKLTVIGGLVAVTSLYANNLKIYEVKSGKVEYSISGGGSMGGMMQTSIKGKKRLIFDDYGSKSLTEEVKVTKQTVSGHTTTDKLHKMQYLNGAIIYDVDFSAKQIMRMQNPAMGMMGMMMGGTQKSMTQVGVDMMKQMGGRKIGTDTILGYTCDVWEVMGTKQCLYKGVALKVESNVMGMKNVEVATKASFDIGISDKDFELPDFPVYQMDMAAMMSGQQPQPIDKSRLKAMDEEENRQMDEGMGQMQQQLKEMSDNDGSGKAEQSGGLEAMMLGAMLPQMKKEAAKDKVWIDDAYDCFEKSDTKKEAQECADKISKVRGEPSEPIEKWDAAMKKETLESIKAYGEQIDCIMNAKNGQEFAACSQE